MFKRSLFICVCAIALLTIPFVKAKAQSLQAIEDQARFYLDRINEYQSALKKAGVVDDSLNYYNQALRVYLKDMLVREPHTLQYGFNKLGWRMKIASSKDKRFRIYSWDEQRGGEVHKYSSIIQYVAADDQVRVLAYRSGYNYTKFFQVTAKNTHTYYLAERKGIHSNNIQTEGLKCFTIENDAINDSAVLFASHGELVNSMDVEIDWAISETKRSEVRFSSDNRLMYFPLVVNRSVTKRYLIYEFDGEAYVYLKNGKN